jgi:hypothetical protein
MFSCVMGHHPFDNPCFFCFINILPSSNQIRVKIFMEFICEIIRNSDKQIKPTFFDKWRSKV